MVLGTHILDIGLSKVSQLPLHLFTNTLYGQNKASPIPSFTLFTFTFNYIYFILCFFIKYLCTLYISPILVIV